MEPPKLPPKRTRPLDPNSFEYSDSWQNKRQRPIGEHVTRRRPLTRQQPPQQNRVSPSSLQANSSFSKSTSSTSTHILPGGVSSETWSTNSSPWTSESSLIGIFWTRAFMSVRSTLVEALGRLLRLREEELRVIRPSPRSVLAARAHTQPPERRLAAF
ncbi:hypothetical protein FRC07_014424, partial [Ceratobasidium sp. 392]